MAGATAGRSGRRKPVNDQERRQLEQIAAEHVADGISATGPPE